MNKDAIRKIIYTRLALLSDSMRAKKDKEIIHELVQLDIWRNAKKVCCFQAMPHSHEVATTNIITILKTNPGLELTLIEASLDANHPLDHFDVIIVPVVAFDSHNNRLGRGGGWYDRFLATQPRAYKLGLAYSEQHIDSIDVEPHDIALDAVLHA